MNTQGISKSSEVLKEVLGSWCARRHLELDSMSVELDLTKSGEVEDGHPRKARCVQTCFFPQVEQSPTAGLYAYARFMA